MSLSWSQPLAHLAGPLELALVEDLSGFSRVTVSALGCGRGAEEPRPRALVQSSWDLGPRAGRRLRCWHRGGSAALLGLAGLFLALSPHPHSCWLHNSVQGARESMRM